MLTYTVMLADPAAHRRRGRTTALGGLAACLVLLLAGLAGTVAEAQSIPGHDQGMPDPIPPPLPPRKPPEDAAGYQPLIPESDQPWGLEPGLLTPLYRKADVYANYASQFTCVESARIAEYGHDGQVSKEREHTYGYTLVKSPGGEAMREYRQERAKDGSLKSGEVKDDEPFPPAYAWVFLFSRFNEPYFSYRDLGETFDGFDWVLRIQFRGSLAFTDGQDIRQWEGVALIDAVTYTPLQIRAEPAGQHERIESLYLRWSKSFNIFGTRTGPKPLGYKASIEFRHRREGLTFPTELRYDTFRAVDVKQIVPVHASTRTYEDYRFTRVETTERIGEGDSPQR